MDRLIRAASTADRDAVQSLIRREVARGTVLPRAFTPDDFLVMEEDGCVVGTLALTPWSDGVTELGTIIAARPGLGIGSALLSAGAAEAQRRGADRVVVLTASPGFFARAGFSASADPPWARARGPVLLQDPDEALQSAISTKASSSCRRCPKLARCRQHLLTRALAPADRAVA